MGRSTGAMAGLEAILLQMTGGRRQQNLSEKKSKTRNSQKTFKTLITDALYFYQLYQIKFAPLKVLQNDKFINGILNLLWIFRIFNFTDAINKLRINLE